MTATFVPWSDGGGRDLAAAGGEREAIVEGFLRRTLARVARVDPSGIDRLQPMTACGLDSLASVELLHAVEAELGTAPSLAEVLDGMSLAEAARRLLAAPIEPIAEPAAGAAVPPAGGPGEHPLSYGQKALWIAHGLDPESAVYNIAGAARLAGGGAVDVEALRRALQSLVDRHAALRTTYADGPRGPVQRVHPRAAAELLLVEASGWSAEELQRRLRAEAFRPFDLANGPVLRMALFDRGPAQPEGSLLVLAVHHIAADFWSLAVLARELGALYSAPAGFPMPASERSTYVDWSRRQEAEVAGPQGELDWQFWRRRLAGLPPLELSADRPRPRVQSFRGAACARHLDGAATAALGSLAAAHGCTLYMVVLAGFQALLARYSGQEDFAVGSPTSGRGAERLSGLVGYLVNPVVLRAELAGEPTVAAHLARVRRTALDALAHQGFPFALLAERLRPERDPGRSPLVQVLLTFEKAPTAALAPLAAFALGLGGARLDLGALVLESVALETPAVPFDLSLSAAELPAEPGLALSFQLATDLFDATTAARMAEAFVALLRRISDGAELPLSALPLLSAAARHQVLAEWNDTAAAPPQEPVASLLARLAAASPAAPALLCGEARLTRGELARRAADLARRLSAAGVARGARVGLALERSVDLAVGLLGIWRAGAVYLPLDPSLPPLRLAFLAADAALSAIVTREAVRAGCRDWLPAAAAVVVLATDGEGETAAAALPAAPALDDVAYLIYTSGTTGQPKGVEVTHRALAAVLAGVGREAGWRDDDRMLSVSPFSFDIFFYELLAPLLAGGVCELLAEISPLDLDGLLGGLAAATRFHAVPALMRRVAAAVRSAGIQLPRLRTLFVGGDAVPADLVAELAALFPRAEVRVLYGPTEGTILAASQRFGTGPGADTVPRVGTALGRPLPGVEVRLYDAAGHLAAIGAPGEIYLGGAGVARGYLGRPELTAERFVVRHGARLYRTGDRARWLPDGRLEFLGRVDQQVKVRGFRVEPAEIEATLRLHPAVGDCAVLAREDSPGDRRLVAYVAGTEVPGLRAFLGERLPEHMLPALFVFLPALPVTAHGKVDRRALPAPAAARSAAAAPYVAPQNAVEERLAAIWRELLHLERVGGDDNFFALGGDSILGLQMLSRAAQSGLRLTLREIFRHPTLAGLAAVAGSTPTADAAEESAPEEAEGEVPLTPAQRGFFERGLPRPHHWNWSAAGLSTVGAPPPPGVLERALGLLSRHHDALRLRFVPSETGWRQLYGPEPAGAGCGRIDLSALAGETQPAAVATAAAAAQASLDLSRGPLLRAWLFDLGAGRPGRLLLVVHHLVMDGVSWRILTEDLEAVCRQLSRGEAVRLPPKTSSFGAWARRLAAHAATADLRDEAAYWLAQGGEAALLPLDSPRREGTDREASARSVRRALDAAASRSLLAEIHGAYQTRIDDVLRTALLRAFSGWTGRRALCVDLEGHGRDERFADLDLSRTVGWLTAVHRVRLDLGAVRGCGEELSAIKEQGRRIPDGGMGYGILCHLAAGAEGAELAAKLREPRAEVLFSYLGRASAAAAGEGGAGGSLFAPAPEPSGPAVDPGGRRSHLLAVHCWVAGGRLETDWSYSADLHRRSTVERLADGFLDELRALIAHCGQPGAGGYSATDFPEAELSARELESLLGRLGGDPRGAMG